MFGSDSERGWKHTSFVLYEATVMHKNGEKGFEDDPELPFACHVMCAFKVIV
jgi:hypothetical protein